MEGAPDVIQVAPTSLASDGAIELRLSVDLPDGAHLNPEAPWSVRATADGKTLFQETGFGQSLPIVVRIQSPPREKPDVWEIALSAVCCTDGQASACTPCEATWRVPVDFADGANAVLNLPAPIGGAARIPAR